MQFIGCDQMFFKGHEKGRFWGKNDLLAGLDQSGKSVFSSIYLHYSDTSWAKFTGFLREHMLPWRWKAVWVRNGQEAPRRILICTAGEGGELSKKMRDIYNQSLLFTLLISLGRHKEIKGTDFFIIKGTTEIKNLGRWGCRPVNAPDHNYQIHRIRSLFSFFTYHFKRLFFSSWKEVSIEIQYEGISASEKILIRADDEKQLLTRE